MKAPSPLLGFNNNVRHKGRVFHIQTEDSGVRHPHIITHLFADGGRILKTTKTSYAEYIDTANMGEVVRQMMQDQHKAMFMALRDGQFDSLLEDSPKGVPAARPSQLGPLSAPRPPSIAGKLATSPESKRAPSAVMPAPAPSQSARTDAAPQTSASATSPSMSAPSAPPKEPALAAKPPSVAAVSAPPSRPLSSAATMPAMPATTTAAPPPTPITVIAKDSPPPPPPEAPPATVGSTAREQTPPRVAARPRLDIDPAAIHRAPAPASVPAGSIASLFGTTADDGPRIDMDTLERAAVEAETPLFQQIHDLPPPPAAVLGKRGPTGPGGYSSVASPAPAPVPSPVQAAPPSTRGRYAPSRPSSIFSATRPQDGASIFGEDLISEKSLDEVILSYLAEDLDNPSSDKK